MKHLTADEAEQHIHSNDDQAEDQQQRCIAQNQRNACRNADGKIEQIDQPGSEFLGPMHGFSLFRAECCKQHGNGRNPYILRSEERAEHIQEPVPGRNQTAESGRNELGNRDDDHTVGHAVGNILQGNILAGPVLFGLGFPVVFSSGFEFIDMRVRVMSPEPCISGNPEQHHEVDGHVQIVCDRGSRNQGIVHLKRCRKRGEIDASADIGACHHGSYASQSGNGILQQFIAENHACDRTGSTDQEDRQHRSGFMHDLLQIGLQQ